MNTRNTMTIGGLIATAALSLPASGAILTTTGLVTQIPAPLSCAPAVLLGNTAWAWDELQGFASASLPVDMVNFPGASNGAPIAGNLTGVYDSHFLHLDGAALIFSATGTITFDGPIVGLIFNATSLDNTDIFPGAPGTTYPTFFPNRGLNTTTPSWVTVVGATMSFNLNTVSPILELGEVRVITRKVPAPGAGALLALSGGLSLRRRR